MKEEAQPLARGHDSDWNVVGSNPVFYQLEKTADAGIVMKCFTPHVLREIKIYSFEVFFDDWMLLSHFL